MEMELIHQIGNWKIYKVPNVSPEEFVITNGYRKYYNLIDGCAIRLADLLNRADLENNNLQMA